MKIVKIKTSKLVIIGLLFLLSVGAFIPQVSHAQQEIKPDPVTGKCPPGYFPVATAVGESTEIHCQQGASQAEAQKQAQQGDGGFWGLLYNMLLPERWVAGAIGWTISTTLLPLAAYLTDLAGVVLNYSVFYTVVQMASNLSSEANPINTAWSLVRDVANIGFIFVLLYAAIKTILGMGEDNQRLIVSMIVAAVLVNFSLFFTKLIIDAANVIALFFYDAIVPAGATGDWHVGISNALMAPLKLQSILNAPEGFDNRILVIGVMGIILSLIAAFVFFAVALLFIIRYVVLIFVLILSPLMFVSMVLPNTQKYTKQWWDALSGQAFFAPIYFLMTWIVVVLSNGLFSKFSGSLANVAGTVALGQNTQPSDDSIVLLVNFIIIIGLLIGSLIIAKEWASKGGKGVGSLVNYATGLAGGASFGLAARATRYTLGAEAETLKGTRAYKTLEKVSGQKTIFGAASRMALSTTDKARTSSFDARGAGIGSLVGSAGKAGGVGGFEAERKGVREYFERPGTEAFKKRQERARLAEETLKITSEENINAAKKFDINKRRIDEIEQSAKNSGVMTPAEGVELATLKAEQANLQPLVNEFELAINKATNKEIETILKTNRDLIKTQEFANKINVQQLEAINKSDEFTEEEKNTLKKNRFESFSAGSPGLKAIPIPTDYRYPKEEIAARIASGTIKGLKDSELEMVDPELLGNDEFVASLKPTQIETLNKSNKFTSTQRDTLRDTRRRPLMSAIRNNDAAGIKTALKTLGPKEVAGLDIGTLQLSNLIEAYTPEFLKRMAPDLSPADNKTLRDTIMTILAIGNPVYDWLDRNEGRRYYP